MDDIEKTEDTVQGGDTETLDQSGATDRRLEGEPADTPAAPDADAEEEKSDMGAAAEREVSPRPASFIDGKEHEVDPRSVTAARIVTVIPILAVAVGPFLGITIGWAFEGIPTYVYLPLLAGWFVLFGSALAFAYRWPELHHRHLRYRVDEAGVRIRRGVWWRQVISIPTSRVQHTDVSQGPLQRHFELATLTVFTAGTEGASISLEGLEHGVAKRLRDHLLPDHHADAA